MSTAELELSAQGSNPGSSAGSLNNSRSATPTADSPSAVVLASLASIGPTVVAPAVGTTAGVRAAHSGLGRMLVQRDYEIRDLRAKVEKLQAELAEAKARPSSLEDADDKGPAGEDERGPGEEGPERKALLETVAELRTARAAAQAELEREREHARQTERAMQLQQQQLVGMNQQLHELQLQLQQQQEQMQQQQQEQQQQQIEQQSQQENRPRATADAETATEDSQQSDTEDRLKAWVLSNGAATAERLQQLDSDLQRQTELTCQMEQQCAAALAAVHERDHALVQYHAALQQRDDAIVALQQSLHAAQLQAQQLAFGHQPREQELAGSAGSSDLEKEELVNLRQRVLNLSAELAAQLAHNGNLSDVVAQLLQRTEALAAERESVAEQLRMVTKPYLFPASTFHPTGHGKREHTEEDFIAASPRTSHNPSVVPHGAADAHAYPPSAASDSSTASDADDHHYVRRGWFGWFKESVYPQPV